MVSESSRGVGMADVEEAKRRCSERKQRDKRRACSGHAAWGLYGHSLGFTFLREERTTLAAAGLRADGRDARKEVGPWQVKLGLQAT